MEESSADMTVGLSGQTNLSLDGFLYSVKTRSVNKIRWRCVNSVKYKCGGAVTTSADCPFKDPQNFKAHSHPPNVHQKDVIELRRNLRASSTTTEEKPIQVLAAALRDVPDEVKANVGKLATIKRDIRKQRQDVLPSLPKNVADLKIPEEWQTTGGEAAKPFLIFDSGPSERAVVFGTEDAARILGSSSHWFMDGTFSTSSKLFQQLYVVRGMKADGIVVTCVYAFMTHKTTNLYNTVLNALLQLVLKLGVLARPDVVTIDFETSVISSLRCIFGENVKIRCCYFHLCQSTWRHIQSLGLVSLYRSRDDIKLYCGMLDALAFLPADDVAAGMLLLWTTAPVELCDLLLYFDSTYVAGTNGSSPLFPPALWNVLDTVMENQQKTNNYCEAWNRRFKEMVGKQNPSFWAVLRAIQKDEALERTKSLLQPHEANENRQKLSEVKLREYLKQKCTEYREGKINIETFLKCIGKTVRLG